MAQVLITGRHVDVTPAMKEYAREKAGKLAKIHERLTKIEVTLDVEHHQAHRSFVVEIVASGERGAHLVGKVESPDLYAGVDLAEDKVVRQLIRHKDRLVDSRRPPGESLPDTTRPEGPGHDGVAERLGED
jgi:putative sigma-54 modulation protein